MRKKKSINHYLQLKDALENKDKSREKYQSIRIPSFLLVSYI